KTHEAVVGCEPKVTVTRLNDRAHGILRQSVVDGPTLDPVLCRGVPLKQKQQRGRPNNTRAGNPHEEEVREGSVNRNRLDKKIACGGDSPACANQLVLRRIETLCQLQSPVNVFDTIELPWFDQVDTAPGTDPIQVPAYTQRYLNPGSLP